MIKSLHWDNYYKMFRLSLHGTGHSVCRRGSGLWETAGTGRAAGGGRSRRHRAGRHQWGISDAFGCADPCQACFTGEYPTLLYDEEVND